MLLLETAEREQLWRTLVETIEKQIQTVADLPVAPKLEVERFRGMIESCEFHSLVNPVHAIRFVADGMREYQVHCPHPRYFGLFNPAPARWALRTTLLPDLQSQQGGVEP